MEVLNSRHWGSAKHSNDIDSTFKSKEVEQVEQATGEPRQSGDKRTTKRTAKFLTTGDCI